MTAHAHADLLTEVVMNAEPGAILAPGAQGLVGGLPMRQIMGHQALGAAAAQHILEAIDHLPHRVFAGSSSWLFRREQRG